MSAESEIDTRGFTLKKSMPERLAACALCGKFGAWKPCGRCHSIYYCNDAHKYTHRGDIHQAQCVPVSIKSITRQKDHSDPTHFVSSQQRSSRWAVYRWKCAGWSDTEAASIRAQVIDFLYNVTSAVDNVSQFALDVYPLDPRTLKNASVKAGLDEYISLVAKGHPVPPGGGHPEFLDMLHASIFAYIDKMAANRKRSPVSVLDVSRLLTRGADKTFEKDMADMLNCAYFDTAFSGVPFGSTYITRRVNMINIITVAVVEGKPGERVLHRYEHTSLDIPGIDVSVSSSPSAGAGDDEDEKDDGPPPLVERPRVDRGVAVARLTPRPVVEMPLNTSKDAAPDWGWLAARFANTETGSKLSEAERKEYIDAAKEMTVSADLTALTERLETLSARDERGPGDAPEEKKDDDGDVVVLEPADVLPAPFDIPRPDQLS